MTIQSQYIQQGIQPSQHYSYILERVKKAQEILVNQHQNQNINRNNLDNSYNQLLIEGKSKLFEINELLPNWSQQEVLLNLNLKLLNNYYKYLFTRAYEEAQEDIHPESLSELKYHLTEIIEAWKRIGY
ncbi:MAG: hypothetical protein ACK481_10745 [Candidatus Melainabacteria bacterium]|jgi:hypothetical protein